MSIRLAATVTAVLSIVAFGAELRIRTSAPVGSRLSFQGRSAVTEGRVHAAMTRERAIASGVDIVASLPDGRVMASVPQLEASLLEVEMVQPGSKLSAAISFQEDWQHVLVLFHADVERSTAERILLDIGVVRVEHPDLLPSQWLVKADVAHLESLAERDEVAYLFPASEDVIQGAPVLGCIGPLVYEGPMAQYVASMGQGWDGEGKGAADLRYAISTLTEQLPRETITEVVQRALSEWSRYAQVRFVPVGDVLSSRTLTFQFATGDHGDHYPFDGKGLILAHTYYPADVNPEPIAGDVHLDEEETWTIGGRPDLYSVVVHEIGHALGLGHSDRPGSVMYPYYRILNTLQPDDISALQRLYAAPTSAPAVVPPLPEPPAPPPTTPTQPPPVQPPLPSTDVTAPSLSIITPTTASYSTSAATLRIAGTSRDNVGVVAVTWQRGSDSGVASGTSAWSFNVPLLRGTNSVTIRAKDAAGNTGWRSLVITRR